MGSNKKIRIISAVIFFLLGITLGIISAWGYKVRNPNHIQYRISDISNNEQSATDMGKTPFKNDFTNEPVEMPQDDRDQELAENLSPDEKYYREARVLQKKYLISL